MPSCLRVIMRPIVPMAPFSPIPLRHPIRVVLSSTAFLPFMSVRKAAALAIAQLGMSAFFIAGVTRAVLGESAAWFVLAATVLAALARAIDIESSALLIPGGFVGRVAGAFGARVGGVATAATLAERLLLGALACVVAGHYVAAVAVTAIAGSRFTGHVRPEDLATLFAVGTIGVLWMWARIGRDPSRDTVARSVWIGVGVLTVTMLLGRDVARRGQRHTGERSCVVAAAHDDHGLVAHRCRTDLRARIRPHVDGAWGRRGNGARRP